MGKQIDLLFCHASGLCQQVWKPVIQHIIDQSSKANASLNINPRTFDFSFHGQEAPVTAKDKRIKDWPTWGPREILAHCRSEPSDDLKIGIGHSLGGACLLLAEQLAPGTFDGLILFEPPIFPKKFLGLSNAQNPFYLRTIDKQHQWPSMAAAEKYFQERPFYQGLDQGAVKGLIEGGVMDKKDNSVGVELCCDPKEEAQVYTVVLPFEHFTDNFPPLPVHLVTGATTEIFQKEWYHKFHPLKNVSHSEMPDAGHFMVLEQPAAVAKIILEDVQDWID